MRPPPTVDDQLKAQGMNPMQRLNAYQIRHKDELKEKNESRPFFKKLKRDDGQAKKNIEAAKAKEERRQRRKKYDMNKRLQKQQLKKDEKLFREKEEINGIQKVIEAAKNGNQKATIEAMKEPEEEEPEKPFEKGELQTSTIIERIEGRQSLLPGAKLSKRHQDM